MSLNHIEEKILHPKSGFLGIVVQTLLLLVSIALIIVASVFQNGAIAITAGVVGTILLCLFCILFAGFKVVGPNEAVVLTLFGKYHGTIKDAGFYFLNPFVVSCRPKSKGGGVADEAENASKKTTAQTATRKISTKVETLNNQMQKVNDKLGNPIMIGSVVIWRVVNPTKAVLSIDNYFEFLSIQCDSTIRNTARLYPYDLIDDDPSNDDETTLRGSSQQIALKMQEELQTKVEDAGLEILEVRITNLSYAPEIAAAMLQRQQAVAIIAARQKIVEGAVSMVEMALDKLSEKQIVNLDEERKAAMVSNLLVILCGNRDAQPIVNSGSIY
ncbi:MAG: SPFH domain-containing protein [Sphaerochaetaceae bacterium]|jgi:regulator of protease activity HflC (stomatin/prohibitin superfamily)